MMILKYSPKNEFYFGVTLLLGSLYCHFCSFLIGKYSQCSSLLRKELTNRSSNLYLIKLVSSLMFLVFQQMLWHLCLFQQNSDLKSELLKLLIFQTQSELQSWLRQSQQCLCNSLSFFIREFLSVKCVVESMNSSITVQR